MDDQEFLSSVAQRANVEPETARVYASATLTTLAERISGGEARDLAAQLPKSMKDPLCAGDEPAEAFGADEFVRRVSDRTHVDPGQAEDAARAVLVTVREAVSPGEFDDVTSQLPQDYRTLVGPMA
ncbi:MAG TPA: DUF2267 domain-containing protein [Mycobacteriales bacterium]|jgi:uncharacterized protein (DUF2267 family)|nr:DUF2267 domain-containing protein [Mycobacteriales bacterium]